MDQRKPKKTRSYGESPNDVRTSKLSGGALESTGSGRRSSLSDRHRSGRVLGKGRKEDAEVRVSRDISSTADQDEKLSGKVQAFIRGDGKPQSGYVSQPARAIRPCYPLRNVSVDLSPEHEAFPSLYDLVTVSIDHVLKNSWLNLQWYRLTSTSRW